MSENLKNDSLETSVEESALLELFVEEIKDIYWTENYCVQVLPNWQNYATDKELKGALETIVERARERVNHIEDIFILLNEFKQSKKCFAIENLFEEAEELILEMDTGSATRDAVIVLSLEKLKYHDMVIYNNLVLMAKALGLHEVQEILKASLDKEKQVNNLLEHLASDSIYEKASKEFQT
jgi:ferritin-like metal-binding protein YciE